MTEHIRRDGEITDANAALSEFSETAAEKIKAMIEAKMNESGAARPPFGFVLVAIDLVNHTKGEDFHMAVAHNSERESAAYELLTAVIDHYRREEGEPALCDLASRVKSLSASLGVISTIAQAVLSGGAISQVMKVRGSEATDETHPT